MQAQATSDKTPLQFVQAHAPGRILLSDPSVSKIPHIQTMLTASGWSPHRTTPHPSDALAAPVSAPVQDKKTVWIGSSFLPEQPHPQVKRPAPLGLNIDTSASIHDAGHVSDLEQLLAQAPLDDAHTLLRARHAGEWLRHQKLCKDPALCAQSQTPTIPFVLILDQPRSDPALAFHPNAEAQLHEMLVLAHEAHPHANLLIYAPDRDSCGTITGHFEGADSSPNVTIFTDPANPWDLFEYATAVYTLSSDLGFDAILAGHKPRVFGQPWYAGWGVTEDHIPIYRRKRKLTRTQLTAAALIDYAQWYDPDTQAPTTLELTIARAAARQRAALEDANGYTASNILRWKRPHMTRYFGSSGITFDDTADTNTASTTPHMAWGANTDADIRVEDGLLRSRGLGAALVRPISLICDDIGVYFDPTRPSQMERHILAGANLAEHAQARISALTEQLITSRLCKYNVGRSLPDLPKGHKILVAGQVEDDASIQLGAGDICTNRALILAARDAHPEAILVFKPHPDVEAGLRRGKVRDAETLADVVAHDADPMALVEACDEIWTMTSLIGFEALLRGKPVTCTGAPFYAGWGLTTDIGPVAARRNTQNGAQVGLMGLAHAALIDAPRYFDPKTGAAISPERAVEILLNTPTRRSKLAMNVLSKIRQLRAKFLGLDS